MIERRPLLTFVSHAVVLTGIAIVAFPVYLTFVASTHTAQDIVQAPMPLLPGPHLVENYLTALKGGGSGPGSTAPVARMMWISLVTALVITFGKIAISLLSAFAIVYFRFPFKQLVFWAIFVTLMLPVEVRIFPTYQVISDLHMLNSYAGLTIPLVDPSFTPDGAAGAIKDGTSNTNSDYLANFPYLGTPAGGYQSKPGVPAA